MTPVTRSFLSGALVITYAAFRCITVFKNKTVQFLDNRDDFVKCPVFFKFYSMVNKYFEVYMIGYNYSRTSMARTLMARLPWLFRTRF